MLLGCIPLGAFGDEEALVKALQQYQDRLIKEGGIDASKNSKIYDEIVKPVIKANEDEKPKPKENSDSSGNDTGESPRKDDLSSPAITPNEVKPLDFGAEPSPKPSSSKFEIDLSDTKPSGDAELIFEKKSAATPVTPTSTPVPTAGASTAPKK